jgi:hypothetical protein
MQHTLAHWAEGQEREARRADYLYAALCAFAPHVISDVDRELAKSYPRANHVATLDEETREYVIQRVNRSLNPEYPEGAGILS